MPVNYPSMSVNLKLRFDEDVVTNLAALSGAPLSQDQLAGSFELPAVPGAFPNMLRTQPPFSFVSGRVPMHATVDLQGYRQASTFEMEILFADLPIDPQVVRAAAVEIYLGTVAEGDFALGMATPVAAATTFGRASVLRTKDAAGQALKQNLVLVGTVDEWVVTHDDKTSVARLRGRDLRGLMIDTPFAASPEQAEKFFQQIDLSEDIVGVVQAILSLNPLFSDVAVKVNESEWPDGKISSPASTAALPRHRLGAKGKRKSRPASSGKGTAHQLTLWDLIVRECYLVGAIPFFQGTDLQIRPSRSIFDQARAGIDPVANPTPFRGGLRRATDAASGLPLADPLAFRKLVYGRDVRSITFDRKYGGYQRPKVVRVVTVDSSSDARGQDRTIEATWPADAKLVTRVSTGADASQVEVLNVPVAGIRDKAQLQQIAESVFEEIGRGEMGGTAETPNVASFAGDNSDPDLLRMKPGDGVLFAVDTRNLTQTAPLISTFTDSQRKSIQQQVTELTTLLGDPALALVVATSARSQRAQRFFRVANVHYDWDRSAGIKVVFDFQNYVVARDQKGTVSALSGPASQTFTPLRKQGII